MSLLVASRPVNIIIVEISTLYVGQEAVRKDISAAQTIWIRRQTASCNNHGSTARTTSCVFRSYKWTRDLIDGPGRSLASSIVHVLTLFSGFRLARQLPLIFFISSQVILILSWVLLRRLDVFLCLFVNLMGKLTFLVFSQVLSGNVGFGLGNGGRAHSVHAQLRLGLVATIDFCLVESSRAAMCISLVRRAMQHAQLALWVRNAMAWFVFRSEDILLRFLLNSVNNATVDVVLLRATNSLWHASRIINFGLTDLLMAYILSILIMSCIIHVALKSHGWAWPFL